MKVKIFKVRVADEYREQDQKVVDDFVSKVKIAHTDSFLVKGAEGFRTLIYLYNQKLGESVEPNLHKDRQVW